MIARNTLVLPGKSPAKPYCLIHEGEEIPDELQHHVTNPDAFIPKEEYEAWVTREQEPVEEPVTEEQEPTEEPAAEEVVEEDPQDEEPDGDEGLLPTGKKTVRKRSTSRAKK